MQACDHCHGKKVRCDKTHPCRRCREAGQTCRYTDRSRVKLYSQTHVDTLQRRITRLEERNRLLGQQLASASSPKTQSTGKSQDGGHGYPTQESPGHASERPVDVIGEASYLSITAAGERQYLGSSSGMLLANFIKANVEIDAISRQPSPPRQDEGTTDNSVSESVEISDFPDIPSESISFKLAMTYLNHDHLSYPVISPGSVFELLRNIYGPDKAYYGLHPHEAFVFDMILAVATAGFSASEWHILPPASSHYSRAMSKASTILEYGGLASLRAVILLTQYRMSSSIKDNSASMWHLVGVGSRIALGMGLHRESAYPLTMSTSFDHESGTTEGIADQELSRLCFWSIVCMDRIVSNILGRPLAIRKEDMDTSLPSTVVDDILIGGVNDVELRSNLRHNRMSIFVHIVQYRLICGEIMLTMHTTPYQTDLRAQAGREQLARELTGWRQQTTTLDLSEDVTEIGAGLASCFSTLTWFEMIYHNAMLMLYRPSPSLDVSRDPVAIQMIFDSAKASISSYSSLHRSRKLNHSWLTLQAVFMSGLSYVYAVTMHFQERRRTPGNRGLLNHDPSTIEVVNDTRACSNVLVAVSERWKSLQHCFDVFNRLSDAVLIDVIKFGSMSYTEATADSSCVQSTTSVISSHIPHVAAQGPMAAWPQQHITTQIATQPEEARLASYNPSPLAIENEFRDSFDDLQQLYDQQHVDISVYQLSQAWFDSFGVPVGLDGSTQNGVVPE